jgi:AcrR family transcriptional regulator
MKKADSRVQQTHKALREALIELAAERGFDAITVGDIARCAHVNRATFYRHYQDKYDVLEQIFQEVTGEFTSNLLPPHELASSIDPNNPSERWVRLFEHFGEHDRLYKTLLGRKGSAWFVARVRDWFINFLEEREQLRYELIHPSESRIPKKVAMTLMSDLLISTIAWWLESDKPYSAKEVAGWFLYFAKNGYDRALGRLP